MCFLTLEQLEFDISMKSIEAALTTEHLGASGNKRHAFISYHRVSAFIIHHEQHIHHGGRHGMARGSLSLPCHS